MKKTISAYILALACLAAPDAFAGTKQKPKAPSGAERQRMYLEVLKDCRKKYGGGADSVDAEWSTNYGRTGWWCVTRR